MANAHTLDSIADFADALGQLRFTRIKNSFAEGYLKGENVITRISQENEALRALKERAEILSSVDPSQDQATLFVQLAKKEGLLP